MSRYTTRLLYYERIKKEIERTAKTPLEYETRIRALANKLKL